MKDTGAERRNFVRERTDLPVEIRSGAKAVQARAEYIGFGGAFLSAAVTFLPNSVIEVTMDFPGQLAAFQGAARVVWAHKNKCMGIQFIDLPQAERLKLEQFLIS